jgi:hypothetical protein
MAETRQLGNPFVLQLVHICDMKKTTVLNATNKLPKEFHLDDFLERLLVIEKIDEGLVDLKEGKTVSHEKVKKMVSKWQK